ncbi:MAG: hypothetical protein D6689_19830 [Deltaproteobacteria bacterium]|nr:MAG: hypothetical protein D6689_19830 [Deltaproteobacteria bacterium]
MRAIVLERNKLVNRRLIRFLACAGFDPIGVGDPAELEPHIDGAQVLLADAFDGDVIVQAIRRNPSLRAMMFTAEPLDRCLRYTVEHPQISNVFGRADFASPPRDWELMMVLRRLARPGEAPPFGALLNWGFTGFQQQVADTAGRDRVVHQVAEFIGRLGVPKRIGEMFSELAHEMLMNAMFDAPVDERGEPKYALDRKAALALPEAERPTLRLATDGAKLVLQVTDPFGRLERKHVFAGLSRGLAGGAMDTSHGGAGLGMVVCHNSTVAMIFDVVRGQKTEVTGVFDLDLNLREFRTRGKSLHYFEA